MPSGIEPYSAKTLAAWLTTKGCRFDRQTGGHQFWRNSDGKTLFVPDPVGNHPVTTLVAGQCAEQLGMTLHQVRREISNNPNKGKSTQTRLRAARPQAIYTVENVDTLAVRGELLMGEIRKSGPCRNAQHEDRAVLADLVKKTEHWYRRLSDPKTKGKLRMS